MKEQNIFSLVELGSVEGEEDERHQVPQGVREHNRHKASLAQIKKSPEQAADSCSYEQHKIEREYVDERIDG